MSHLLSVHFTTSVLSVITGYLVTLSTKGDAHALLH